MYIFSEDAGLRAIPKKLHGGKKGRIRAEVCLQTAGEVNRNKRLYSKNLLESGVMLIRPRITDGEFLGELDHPIDKNPVRQITVLYTKASHQFKEIGWDGNHLKAVIETLSTHNGKDLKALAEDGVPIGFSFRGMGDIRQGMMNGSSFYDVQPPLHVVTWDAVSYPSHPKAKLIKITEGVQTIIHEAVGLSSNNGLICTSEGYCYFPNDFDKLVEQRVIHLKNKYLL